MYIDGVFSGGGIKGFALIGAYQAIEQRGLQFVRVAGTSAGSIVASFIAAGYRSDEIIRMMDDMELGKFLEKNPSILPFKLMKWLNLYWRLGLYKGGKLEEWIAARLKERGVSTFGDLRPGSLKIVASDLTNGRIIVLPDDLPSYGLVPERFSVARAVLMSCSLPYFFEPVKLTSAEGTNIVVDGGVLSNFPIWLFKEKARPVIGIKLSPRDEERPRNQIKNAIEMYGALFETMKDAHDARHVSSRHERNIIFLPVESILTTEFDLSEQKKLALIELGRSRTEQFLKRWTY
ncbi:patatin-like phospholipase family protein [Metabacillus sp. cB07]|uniref:patatin-like phospholipase family protein n=1 Tax=Metabacillus sp. cB07 TaxID=2806989 RepID=UPI00193AC882|nr:patatin-like phospholipase family protein [Metabacillus sp. cB07]